MKRGTLVLCICVIWGFLLLAAQEKGPAIVFDSTTKDFGKVTEGETLKHVFKFTNKGQTTLDIVKVEPG
jgi:hypothetical protein